MEPVEWGNVPRLPLHLALTDDHVAKQRINTATQDSFSREPPASADR